MPPPLSPLAVISWFAVSTILFLFCFQQMLFDSSCVGIVLGLGGGESSAHLEADM